MIGRGREGEKRAGEAEESVSGGDIAQILSERSLAAASHPCARRAEFNTFSDVCAGVEPWNRTKNLHVYIKAQSPRASRMRMCKPTKCSVDDMNYMLWSMFLMCNGWARQQACLCGGGEGAPSIGRAIAVVALPK